MAEFEVKGVHTGDTFAVEPDWECEGQNGDIVRPLGYQSPELKELGGQPARDNLARLILGETVELAGPYRVEDGRLVCNVLFLGKNLTDYFPEYKVT